MVDISDYDDYIRMTSSVRGAQHQSAPREVEVTEAMIAAGREKASYGYGLFFTQIHDDGAEVLTEIYRAMERARRKELWG